MNRIPPTITSEQRAKALEKANQIRKQRVELKEKLKTNELTFADLFIMPASNLAASRLKVVTALESLPGIGKVKAKRIMDEVKVPHTRRIAGLGDKQKAQLLQILDNEK